MSASNYRSANLFPSSTHGARTTSSGLSRANVVIGPMVISDSACERSLASARHQCHVGASSVNVLIPSSRMQRSKAS